MPVEAQPSRKATGLLPPRGRRLRREPMVAGSAHASIATPEGVGEEWPDWLVCGSTVAQPQSGRLRRSETCWVVDVKGLEPLTSRV